MQENLRGRGDRCFLHRSLSTPVEAAEEGYADAHMELSLQVEPLQFKLRVSDDYMVELFFFSFLCFRCDLCSLIGEELEKNEELRKELFHLETVADNLYDLGLSGQGLEKLEEKLELMEKHWEGFCMEVPPLFNHLSDLKLLWFSSFPRCATAVSWPLLKQERERRRSCMRRSRWKQLAPSVKTIRR